MNALGIDVGGSGFRIGVFNLATGALLGELERHDHGESTEPEPSFPPFGQRWRPSVGTAPSA